MPRRPIGLRQLCAIARTVIDAEPGIDDAEWKEHVKARLVKQGWAYPSPALLTEALTRVEHARGPRPVRLPFEAPPPTADSPPPLTRDEARTALTQLLTRFGPLPALKPRIMPPAKSELLTMRQRYAIVHAVEDLRARRDEQRAARRDVLRDGDPAAEGQHEGLSAQGLDAPDRDQ